MNLSPHFTIEEFCYSITAIRAGIDNSLPAEMRPHAIALCINLLEPVRNYFGVPVHIDSGWRCHDLNMIVPGSSDTSQHSKAEAVDVTIKTVSLRDIFKYVQDNLKFDQLILEYNSWVHMSWSLTNNRMMTMRKDTGSSYEPYRI
jgi:hypothetical protein